MPFCRWKSSLGQSILEDSEPGPLTNCSPQPLTLDFNGDFDHRRLGLCCWTTLVAEDEEAEDSSPVDRSTAGRSIYSF